jgi:hypothetical protein
MPVMPGLSLPFTGIAIFVDPVYGVDNNDGLAPEPGRSVKTLYRGLQIARDGKNDVIFLIGNGAASGSARLSLALAQAVDSTATSGKLIWNKSATHLIGIAAGGNVANRARIAPPTGTYTAATFASNDFVSVSGTGCYFANFSVQDIFSTGNAAQRCWVDTGGRNFYENVHFDGISTAAAAGSASSRSLVVSGTTGENKFVSCTIGGDTVSRGNFANASLSFDGGSPRNQFIGCIFPSFGSGAGPLFVLTTGATAIDRFVLFEDCKFINAIKSTSTQMTVGMSMDNASPGGLFLIHNCLSIGITKWGDTNALANSFVQVGYATGTTGLGAVPS